MAAAAAARAALLMPVDHALKRVEVKGHGLAHVPAKPTIKIIAAARRGPLDRADMSGPELPRQLPCRRRRRHASHRPQQSASGIVTHPLHIIEALPADHLTLGYRDGQSTRRDTAPTPLDRRYPILCGKLGVNHLHKPQLAQQLTADRHPRVPCQRRIVGNKDEPPRPITTGHKRSPPR